MSNNCRAKVKMNEKKSFLACIYRHKYLFCVLLEIYLCLESFWVRKKSYLNSRWILRTIKQSFYSQKFRIKLRDLKYIWKIWNKFHYCHTSPTWHMFINKSNKYSILTLFMHPSRVVFKRVTAHSSSPLQHCRGNVKIGECQPSVQQKLVLSKCR